jgi:hypothetical protein
VLLKIKFNKGKDMTAYYFRVIQDGEPNGWVGFAMAETMKHLFWTIDEFVDPYAVEIQTAKVAGYCYHMNRQNKVTESKHEFSEHEADWDEGRWRKPIWVTDVSFCSLISDK